MTGKWGAGVSLPGVWGCPPSFPGSPLCLEPFQRQLVSGGAGKMAVTTFYRARIAGAGLLLLAMALSALTGCDTARPTASGAEPTAAGGKLAVVATTTQIRS